MDDLREQLPKLLLLAGGLMQWLRAFKGFREWMYHVTAVTLCAAAYILVTPSMGNPRTDTVNLLVWFVDAMPLAIVYGGTFLVSNAAKNPALNPASNLVPLTNSK